MGEVVKPFICPEQNCEMSFTNEDRLQVHRRCHEIQLSINNQGSLQPTSSLVKHTGFLIDQTPTPTRFLKHCEEVSLFQDINLNPFDLEFRKASQNRSYKAQLSLTDNHGVSGSLETPRILPPVDSDETISSTSRDDPQLSASSSLHPSSAIHSTVTIMNGIMNTPSPQLNTPRVIELEKEAEKREGRKRLTLNVSSASEVGQSSSIISTPTPVITAGPSVSQSLSAVSCSTPTLNTPNILTANIPQITLNGVGLGLSDLGTPGLSPTLRLTSSPLHIDPHSSEQAVFAHEEVEARVKTSSVTCMPTSVQVPTSPISSQPGSTVPQSPSATVLQLLLRLPDGQAIPVEIPATPVVSSISTNRTTTSVATCIAPAYQTTAFTSVITNPTPSLAKMKLKQALASSNTAARPGVTKHSRATTADRIAEMTRNRNASGASSNGEDSSSSSCSSGTSSGNNSSNSKGGRRRRNSNPDENPEEKRRKFLERNRVAAVRCREKKKRLVENMVAKSDELGFLNQKLQSEVASLRSEVANLKWLLLRHKNCPVTIAMQGGEEVSETKFQIEESTGFMVKASPPISQATVPSPNSQAITFIPIKTPLTKPPPTTLVHPVLSLPQTSSPDTSTKLRKRSLSLSSIPLLFPSPTPLSLSSSNAATEGINNNTRIIISSDGMVKPAFVSSYPASTTSTAAYSSIISTSPKVLLHPFEPPRTRPEHSLDSSHLTFAVTGQKIVPALGKPILPSFVSCPPEVPQVKGINVSFPIETRMNETSNPPLIIHTPSSSSLGENGHQQTVRRNAVLIQESKPILPKESRNILQGSPANLSSSVIIDNSFCIQSKIVINQHHQTAGKVSTQPQR